MEDFGKRLDIKENLWRARLTQSEAARHLDMTKQHMNDWCTGKSYPKPVWERILKQFFLSRGITLAYKED